jgi:signal peptidase I
VKATLGTCQTARSGAGPGLQEDLGCTVCEDGGHMARRLVPTNRRSLGCLIEIAETLVLTLIIFWAVQTFLVQPFQVQQESMRATLSEGEYVLVDKLTPRFDAYSRGDIVVFQPQRREESCDEEPSGDRGEPGDAVPFIKRVIGEPGDVVSIRNGNVLVNGSMLDEPYVSSPTVAPGAPEAEWQVPADRLFVMGDNRGFSNDSRSASLGPICIRDVVGRAWMRYWPLDRIGILPTPEYVDAGPS